VHIGGFTVEMSLKAEFTYLVRI